MMSKQESAPLKLEVASGDVVFDAEIYVNDERLIVELERRAVSSTDLAAFALLAYRYTEQLRNRRDIATSLREAVSAVRQLTGFNRVMSYRSHADDSGEVVAEECLHELESFLHRRFSALDIPPQARALYVPQPRAVDRRCGGQPRQQLEGVEHRCSTKQTLLYGISIRP